MKTLNLLSFCFLLFIALSCCNDDDDHTINKPTNHELLMSGKWYIESTSDGPLTVCEKQSYLDFIDTSNLISNNFDKNLEGECTSWLIINNNYVFLEENQYMLLAESEEDVDLLHTIENISSDFLELTIHNDSDNITVTYRK